MHPECTTKSEKYCPFSVLLPPLPFFSFFLLFNNSSSLYLLSPLQQIFLFWPLSGTSRLALGAIISDRCCLASLPTPPILYPWACSLGKASFSSFLKCLYYRVLFAAGSLSSDLLGELSPAKI